ncbi:hypothetical protein GCM10023084_05400 [Streptomyces lacrimifluminis]|uniref:DNA-binding protein n=1 Tax=Streptomyces lacrimifluminis TaxID=1500077 RepID=A0A917KQI3_9ACTN|nr:hypothetical protein [Streptomyces lacrimifluminis]GGJ22821.1 hypothetical protein GCM10012282_19140 [Streptomyces lacrimifluminis]
MDNPARRTKHERRVPLPAGIVPLLTQRAIETYYGVSTWQITQWLKAGMPEEPFAGQGRRYDLAKCQAWHEANATDGRNWSTAAA